MANHSPAPAPFSHHERRLTMVTERKQIGVRLTLEDKQKLDALASLLGVSTTKTIAILVDKAYTENKNAIESMIASRNKLRTSEATEPLS